MFEAAIIPDLIIIRSPQRVSTFKSAAPPRRRLTVSSVILVIMRLIILEMAAFVRPRLSLSQALVALVVTAVTAGVIGIKISVWLDHSLFDVLVVVFDPLLKGALC